MNFNQKDNNIENENGINTNTHNAIGYQHIYNNGSLFYSDEDSWYSDEQISHNSVFASICQESIQERYNFIRKQYIGKIQFQNDGSNEINDQIQNQNIERQSSSISKEYESSEIIKEGSLVQQKSQVQDIQIQGNSQNQQKKQIYNQKDSQSIQNVDNIDNMENGQNLQNIEDQFLYMEYKDNKREQQAYFSSSQSEQNNDDQIFYSDSENGQSN